MDSVTPAYPAAEIPGTDLGIALDSTSVVEEIRKAQEQSDDQFIKIQIRNSIIIVVLIISIIISHVTVRLRCRFW